ncbi:kelch-like protein 26 isoform X3 [Mercenaria mercenaria]|uniref:kelch-like protein 26 isoform X3 n=1 Tax=Mercenaria mercenaria TaxID=6596 RepID=UPI001E1DD0A2|nr:kelch-like protein 26 isoform X3 [Mercenaria mercenaria]
MTLNAVKRMATGRSSVAVHNQKYATPQFSDMVLHQMYKFYEEGQYCDFSIKVEGKLYKVHRLVLASSSDYFRAMLSHDMVETREECTDLKGMTIKGVEPLIEYAYTGKLELTLDNIHHVISGATFLQISAAIDLCVNFLKENMTFENADELLKIGDMFNVPSLREYYRAYLLKNFLKFVESDTFLNIDADSLADYLSDDALITTSESMLFHHCLRWYDQDAKNREKDAYKVFEKVRMTHDRSPLIHFASNHELFQKNQKCKDILEFSEQYLNNNSKRYIDNTSFRTKVRSVRQTIVQVGGVMETHEDYDTFRDMLNQPSDERCGWNMNNYFHPDLKAWFALGNVGNFSSRRSHQQFVEVNGCGVMVGGYEYHVTGENVSKMCIKDVMMFTAQGQFDICDMPDLLHERARHAAVYLDGCIYAIAGKDDRQTLKSVEKLDCHNEEWSYVKPLPRKLFDHAAVACNGKVYVSGGAEFKDAKKSLWCYDPQRNNWNKRKDMNCARAGHGTVCLDSKLYVAGGYNGNREATNPDGNLRCLVSVEQYSVETNQWTKMSAMKHGIAFFTMTVLDGRMVVLGGVDSAGRLTQYMHEYLQDQDGWKIFGELPRPLKNASCGAVVVKLTDTGCMEDETDDIKDEYRDIFEDYELENMDAAEQESRNQSRMMMENFDPGDYLLDDEDSPGDWGC